MNNFTLTNQQRKYFGIEPIQPSWDKAILEDKFQSTILYFEGNVIKRQILSTDKYYKELQFDEQTNDRKILLPKTSKGKEQKLTNSTLDKRKPIGNYVEVSAGYLTCGNIDSQRTFYSSRWDQEQQTSKSCEDLLLEFIENSNANHLKEINIFSIEKRKNIKYKTGDYFRFKISRNEYGFGRILLDINKIRKQKLIDSKNGLFYLMGPPLLVQIFAYRSLDSNIEIEFLDKQPKLPSDYIMDNRIFYGEYEIIGHRNLKDDEFDFPISYGKKIDFGSDDVFLQWGLIHLELPMKAFSKYLHIEGESFSSNPYGYYSIGYDPSYANFEIDNCLKNNGILKFSEVNHYKAKYDLRNPNNRKVKYELFKVFGLDPHKTYIENSELTSTPLPNTIIEKIK
ncbi:immunity 26/phosphotriesterase HocA family protein [Sphingobacterium lactis]|uniref:Immunity protein 26 n=1 Tax=Sphingobacterium lactis TaxID=797291 RepID=A0A1H6CFM4_9SPHI|nr:immunity 26/phosphotriesterase HocA family protein [Sphingobacterium lactis]SEG71829.1 Immunity protein 26 [Sphingobacterium lactis]